MNVVGIRRNIEIREHLHKLVAEGRMPHALLISERESYGAMQLAVDLACCLLGNDVKAEKLVHPDLHLLFPINKSSITKDAARKDLSVEDFLQCFRELYAGNPFFDEGELCQALQLEGRSGNITVAEISALMHKLSMSAFMGDVKVALVVFPETMNEVASNKLLKTLEEPTPGTYIIMVTRSRESILPTILSRCSMVEVPSAPIDEVATLLAQEYGLEDDLAAMLSRKAAESWGLARRYALQWRESSSLDEENRERFLRILGYGIRRDLVALQDEWPLLASLSKEEQKSFCETALETLRSIYVIKLGLEQISYMLPEQNRALLVYAQNLKPLFYEKAYEFFGQAIVHINANVNSKFIFCDLCNRIFHYA